jgi:uncharacterized membrane protein YfcA
MELALIAASAFAASLLTLFSGFGLGTLLMPVLALFFPVSLAVAMTAVVHFSNNLFKLALFGRYADKSVVLKFGMPAIFAAFAGAFLLSYLSHFPPLWTYSLGPRTAEVTLLKMLMAALMLFFSVFEWLPATQTLAVDRKYLVPGGLLSGFLGGLSGHQGALRSIFLLNCGLSKEAFIGTGVVVACLVDFSRLTVYRFEILQDAEALRAVVTGILSAFAGAWLGARLFKKITLGLIQKIVSVLLAVIALALGAGLI